MENMYTKNTLQYDSTQCAGCSYCTQVCPHSVFAMKNKKAVIVNQSACMECGACKMNCAYDAINVTSGTGCGTAMIFEAVTGKDIGAGLFNTLED